MIEHLSKKEQAFINPQNKSDRRVSVAMKPYMWIILCLLVGLPLAAAWIQYLGWGLPADPSAKFVDDIAARPSGFPAFIRISHWVNFLFLTLIMRSGLSILFDHPRLYFDRDCTPGSEWIRFTPVKVPDHKVWTAKEDARYISPWMGLPGYRHTVGLARTWHFLTVPFFIINGAIFIILLLTTDQWQRLVPSSWQIIPDSWAVFVHYATFHFPIEPNGFYHYNALQQVAYFVVVFVLAPLAILTGMAMSPAIENRFHWYPQLFGGRQAARTGHFFVLVTFAGFIFIHVALVAATGLVRNMNHIVLGTDSASDYTGLMIGIAIILFVTALCFVALWISWHRPRSIQRAQKAINENLWRRTIDTFKPRKYYTRKDISPHFWPNGKMPESDVWKNLAKNNFKDYKLKIYGLVDNPVELSLDELKALAEEETITMHHCIQGWSGVSQWAGVPLSKIIERVRPKPEAHRLAFISFGEGLYGGVYYDTHTIYDCMKPESILAWEMNYEPLPLLYGAPLRLRVENQLGYKMVKWIESIEFIASKKDIGKGYGGKNEDDEYFDLLANT